MSSISQVVLHDVCFCTIKQKVHTREGADNLMSITCLGYLVQQLELLLDFAGEEAIVVGGRAEKHATDNSYWRHDISTP